MGTGWRPFQGGEHEEEVQRQLVDNGLQSSRLQANWDGGISEQRLGLQASRLLQGVRSNRLLAPEFINAEPRPFTDKQFPSLGAEELA